MFLYITILFVALLIILLYLKLTSNKDYWKKLNVPYVKPKVLFGNVLPLMKQDVCRGIFFGDLYASTEGSYYAFFTLNKPCILLRDLNLIKSILIQDFDYFSDRIGGNCKTDKIGNNLLFFTKGKTWKTLRYNLSPIFSSGKLRNMYPYILNVGDDLVRYIDKKISNQESLDPIETILMYTADTIASCFFGFSAKSLKEGDKQFYEMSKLLTEPTFLRTLQMSCFFLIPALSNLFKMKLFEPSAENYLQTIFLNVMEDRKRSDYLRGDLIDLLIKLQKNDTNVLSNEEILAQSLQFHFAGFDTSSYSIAFILMELCLNPVVQTKLRQEVKGILKKHEKLSYDALNEMDYLDMVVSEGLRLHPVVPIIDRICTKPYNIKNANITIEKNISVIVSVFGIHRDSAYFPNPDKFDPERFSPVNKAKIIPGSYIPFGDGPRNCIGLRFALLSIKLALVKIVDNFNIELGKFTNLPVKYDPKHVFLTPNLKTLDIRFKALNKTQ